MLLHTWLYIDYDSIKINADKLVTKSTFAQMLNVSSKLSGKTRTSLTKIMNQIYDLRNSLLQDINKQNYLKIVWNLLIVIVTQLTLLNMFCFRFSIATHETKNALLVITY